MLEEKTNTVLEKDVVQDCDTNSQIISTQIELLKEIRDLLKQKKEKKISDKEKE